MSSYLLRFSKKSTHRDEIFYENGVKVGELMVDDDGFWYFWPEPYRGGCWPSHILRALADEMDLRNKPWEDQIERELGKAGV